MTKCTVCKVETVDEYKKNGRRYKLCTKCRNKNKNRLCEHQIKRYKCYICDGNSRCIHRVKRNTCEICKTYLIRPRRHLQRSVMDQILHEYEVGIVYPPLKKLKVDLICCEKCKDTGMYEIDHVRYACETCYAKLNY